MDPDGSGEELGGVEEENLIRIYYMKEKCIFNKRGKTCRLVKGLQHKGSLALHKCSMNMQHSCVTEDLSPGHALENNPGF